jgi:hypothetical protein
MIGHGINATTVQVLHLYASQDWSYPLADMFWKDSEECGCLSDTWD